MQSANSFFGVFPQRALPNNGHAPSCFPELGNRTAIPCRVFGELVVPEDFTGLGQLEIGAAGVGVPKAAMHEHNRVPLSKNYVWTSLDRTRTHPETVSHRMQGSTHN